MPIELHTLAQAINPQETILFFGAGSSIPSGAPSASTLATALAGRFNLDATGCDLADVATLVEIDHPRSELISEVRKQLGDVSPTGGLLNIPNYDWAGIFTTNYDSLLETAYSYKKSPVNIFTCNFDFSPRYDKSLPAIYKVHGTIEKDVCEGHQSRIIISTTDYELTEEYREQIFDTLKFKMLENDTLIIGYSLSDPHIKAIISRALRIKSESGSNRRITLLIYGESKQQAAIQENRGLRVAFGGIDDFFSQLAKAAPTPQRSFHFSGHPFDKVQRLNATTVDVAHALNNQRSNVSDMFNGWPATYGDIADDLTFRRTCSEKIVNQLFNSEHFVAVILGAAGTGKTTLARQILASFSGQPEDESKFLWEHKHDADFAASDWLEVAEKLSNDNESGVLFIDEAHNYLHELNRLLDQLVAKAIENLKIICVSQRNHWGPRVKTPSFFHIGVSYNISKLDDAEIIDLLALVDSSSQIGKLVENNFAGFSLAERRKRLKVRCEADMFVCLKNIFASDSLDDILLREYAALDQQSQDIYKFVAAMESSGINVHRQLVIRALGLDTGFVDPILNKLSDIIREYDIDKRDGIFGWKGRHELVMAIIARYKFGSEQNFVDLYERVLSNLVPSYEIELNTIRQLCNFETGIQRISSKKERNRLLRRMISIAPGERIPRHRLIRNLIDMDDFQRADTEIRIFEKDFKRPDVSIRRYEVMLLMARADRSPGLMLEDKIVILSDAKTRLDAIFDKFPANKHNLRTFGDLGMAFLRHGGEYAVIDEAITRMRELEPQIGDPDISTMIARYESRVRATGQ
ncbi:SIR2 family protein [uncultured Salinisphaera sp.]|uniref:SIR2 family protein n=1 Tax=uncultured Salinisphaera sp. TaxID=359372 RepID=UPI0032B30758